MRGRLHCFYLLTLDTLTFAAKPRSENSTAALEIKIETRVNHFAQHHFLSDCECNDGDIFLHANDGVQLRDKESIKQV
jgi:hypothetical protein